MKLASFIWICQPNNLFSVSCLINLWIHLQIKKVKNDINFNVSNINRAGESINNFYLIYLK